jgi:hypothetical protein
MDDHAKDERIESLRQRCRELRYDSRTERHHHLVCLAGDRVFHISGARLDTPPVPDTRRYGFVVSDFKGPAPRDLQGMP